jgi:hypothetical protein
MRARNALCALLFAAALTLGLLAAGCGEEESLDVIEGEPLELGDLSYNVSISRFLNPADLEDRAYLVGQPPLPDDKQWFGVFMEIENDGDAQTISDDFAIRDTEDNEFRPVPSRSLFALELGAEIPHDGQLPEPETTAANGVIEGSMILFLIDNDATDNRPLVLYVGSPDGVGEVELDV